MNHEITLSECIFTRVRLSVALLLPIYTRNTFPSGQGQPRGWCLSDRAILQCYPYMPAIVILGVFRVARPCASKIRFHLRPSGGFCGSPFCEESGTQIGWCTGKSPASEKEANKKQHTSQGGFPSLPLATTRARLTRLSFLSWSKWSFFLANEREIFLLQTFASSSSSHHFAASVPSVQICYEWRDEP